MAREALQARAFVRLADTLVSDFVVVDFLYGLSVDSLEILGADAAGVMVTDGRAALQLIASSEERIRLLELFELQSAQGPALPLSPAGEVGPVQAGQADLYETALDTMALAPVLLALTAQW